MLLPLPEDMTWVSSSQGRGRSLPNNLQGYRCLAEQLLPCLQWVFGYGFLKFWKFLTRCLMNHPVGQNAVESWLFAQVLTVRPRNRALNNPAPMCSLKILSTVEHLQKLKHFKSANSLKMHHLAKRARCPTS